MTELLQKMVHDRQLCARDLNQIQHQVDSGTVQAPSEESDVLKWLAQDYGLDYSDLEDQQCDRELINKFPARLLLKENLLPLGWQDGAVNMATSRLFATEGLDALQASTGLTLRPVLCPQDILSEEVRKHLGVGADTIDRLQEEQFIEVIEDELQQDGDLDQGAEDASIIRFVNQVLKDAIEMRASDIHLEPYEEELRIRYRIDGVLQNIPVPAQIKNFQPAIVSRLKILSHLNIAEKRLPQDGRIRLRRDNMEVDVRVSVIPMIHGEAVVLRLLRQDGSIRPLTDLGIREEDRLAVEDVLELQHGIVLVTGPTGSGKTSTLYTALNHINGHDRKIITIEDPVEYQLRGVNQIQVSEKAGLTFSKGLRAILRHDPDVVLVGEIRDLETAQIAIQASLTGHLVFSTLHTNDAPSTLIRLVDMGIEPYLVASSLEMVLAQRLVRTLCPHCKTVDESDSIKKLKESLPILQGQTIYKAVGCSQCRELGYLGRHAIVERLNIFPELREKILSTHSADLLAQCARRNGMKNLADDGWRLVAQGLTTPDEIYRVAKTMDQRGE